MFSTDCFHALFSVFLGEQKDEFISIIRNNETINKNNRPRGLGRLIIFQKKSIKIGVYVFMRFA